jgi:hypothetical protein
MDIRMYFQKVREIERNIQDPYVVVVSLETPEGGKPGRMTEVSRDSAAHLIADGKVRLATTDESAAFHDEAKNALIVIEEAKMAGKIQLTVVSEQANRIVKTRSEKG